MNGPEVLTGIVKNLIENDEDFKQFNSQFDGMINTPIGEFDEDAVSSFFLTMGLNLFHGEIGDQSEVPEKIFQAGLYHCIMQGMIFMLMKWDDISVEERQNILGSLTEYIRHKNENN